MFSGWINITINIVLGVLIILGTIYLYHDPTIIKNSIVIGIISAVIFLLRSFISTAIHSSFEKNLEGFRFSLKALEKEREFIRDMVRSLHFPSDNTKRLNQIGALKNVWENFLELKKYSTLLNTLKYLDVSAVLQVKDDPKIKGFFKTKAEQINRKKLQIISQSAEKTRIWISPMAWSLYLAYEIIINYGLDQLTLLSMGENPETLLQKDKVENLIKQAVPELDSILIDNKLLHDYLVLLEQKFVLQLHEQTLDIYSTQETIEHAKNIAKASSEINFFIKGEEMKRENPDVFKL